MIHKVLVADTCGAAKSRDSSNHVISQSLLYGK